MTEPTQETMEQEQIEEQIEQDEPEYVLNYCRTCMKETKHIVVRDKLLCTICKTFWPNKGRHKRYSSSQEVQEVRGMSMQEFYDKMNDAQLNQIGGKSNANVN